MPPVLELRGITKSFPGVLANDAIDLSLEKGKILALLGENGAGKTTLMNILYGLYKPDKGQIFINGEEVSIHDPSDAIARGIGMVHQHFMLIPVMTATENVMLGVEPIRNGIFLDKAKVAKRIGEISKQFDLEVDPQACIGDLPVGAQQRVEIIKVLYRQADILILDEPTAVLTPQEVEGLFKVMHSLVDSGKSVIFITHKLKEVLAIADDISVLRNGRVVGTVKAKEASQEKLASMMVGRDVNLVVKKKPATPKDVVLSVKNLFVRDERKNLTVNGTSFEVRAGEVLGVAGVQGNGQTELVYALTGLSPVVSGEIRIMDKLVRRSSPRNILERGVAHIPEDRQRHGLILTFPVHDNLVLCSYYRPPFARGVALLENIIVDTAGKLVEQFDVRTPNVFVPVSTLSGGNQQKVIVAREFSRPIKLLIVSQPTRGLDVGSIEYIHGRIIEKRDEGTAVLLVSPELDEIIALSDRIAVMYKGQIVDIVPAARVNKAYLGLLMAGVKSSRGPGGSSPDHRENRSGPRYLGGRQLDSNVTQPNPEAPGQKEASKPKAEPRKRSKLLQTLLVPVLAILSGFIIGAIVIAISNDAVIAAYRNFFNAPGAALAATWKAISVAYGALFKGSIGSIPDITHGIQNYYATGDSKAFLLAIYPFTESLATVTPYILAGLAVGVGFKCGLFNIGAEGQFGVGALCSAFVGYSLHGLPWYIHLPLALLAGAAGGALWGAVPGLLKGLTGAHEVVITIMMNYVSFRLSDWLLNGPMKATGYRPLTPVIENSAMLPRFFPDPLRFNWGFILALAMAGFVFWFLFKTTLGFEIRAVGANPDGARYAGMNIVKNFVIAMTLSGALAGLAGASQVLGIDHWVGQGFSAGYGFDSIAIALLGQSHPVGVVLAALLWGTLRSGATSMQSLAGVPIEIISIIQGLVIVFVAAPAVIRWIYRIKAISTQTTVLTRGWGK